MLRTLLKKWTPSPLDRILSKAQKKGARSFLLVWNRGLGDIPLGLYAVVHRVKEFVPDAKITFLTRPNLREGFLLLGGVEILIAPNLKRGDQISIGDLIDPQLYDVVIENPDPTKWVQWQLGTLVPQLEWQPTWEREGERLGLDPNRSYVGVHVQTETQYANWRNWPLSSFQLLFEKIIASGRIPLLFGFHPEPEFSHPGLIDLRGKTSLFALLAIIKNYCQALIVPDSGVSSMVYYLNVQFPLKQISLWADPHMGILKQNVPSPNKKLHHIPLLGRDGDIKTITVDEVYAQL